MFPNMKEQFFSHRGFLPLLLLATAVLVSATSCRRPEPPLVVAEHHGRQGLMDLHGRKATPFRYDTIAPLSDGMYRVRRKDLWGYLDSLGRKAVKPQFPDAEDFHDGVAVAYDSHSGQALLIDRRGQPVGTETYGWIGRLYAYDDQDNPHYLAGRYVVRRDGRYAMLGSDGQRLTPLVYDDFPCEFFEGLSPVRRDGKWGFVDTLGHEVIGTRYDSVGLFACGLAPVSIGGRWGFVDKRDSLVVPLRYQAAAYFSCRRAPVMIEGHWGFIDPRGVEVIKPQFDDTVSASFPPFPGFRHDGTARVFLRGRLLIIDTVGHAVE